ncbi:MAG TPA: hypothetical protein VNM92_03990 [Thermoanaerobaculia bacterium]|nr:hypothetical protein [Thermoanaerobaculia bacterium]
MNITQRRERLSKWIGTVSDEVSDLLLHRHIFTTLQELIATNPELRQSKSHFFQWLTEGYVIPAASAVRRQAKVDKKAISLARVICELVRYPELVTFDYHASFYKQGIMDKLYARDTYAPFADQSGQHLSVDKLQADLAVLRDKCRIIEHYVDRRIAHYDQRGITLDTPTFADLESAILAIEELTQSYNLLITTIWSMLTPVIQYNWLHIFESPWIPRQYSRLDPRTPIP